MNHPNRINFPISVLTVAIVCVGCNRPVVTGDAEESNKAVPVKTVAVTQVEIAKTTQQPASVHPYFETEIRARVSGYISEVSADIGDVVQAGDRLAIIDVPELDQQRETWAAEIELLTAEEQGTAAGVELAKAMVTSSRAKLDQAKAEQAGVEASLAAAQAEFNRTKDMVDRGSLQSRVLDEVRMKRDSEAAAKEAVASAVSAAEAEVAVAQAEQAAAEARLMTAQAKTKVARGKLKELEVSLNFANVIAPFDGVITERHVNLGDLIDDKGRDGSNSLFHLSKVDRVRVHVPVPEIDAPFVQPGDAITLTFPSFASEPAIQATVTRRTGSLDPSTRTMTVEAELDNTDGKLLPGMFGQASIELETKVAKTMLPSRAVRFDETGNAYVYGIDSQNRVKLAEVTTGMDTGTEIEILSGVQSGELVIGPHLKRFTEGQQVRPL